MSALAFPGHFKSSKSTLERRLDLALIARNTRSVSVKQRFGSSELPAVSKYHFRALRPLDRFGVARIAQAALCYSKRWPRATRRHSPLALETQRFSATPYAAQLLEQRLPFFNGGGSTDCPIAARERLRRDGSLLRGTSRGRDEPNRALVLKHDSLPAEAQWRTKGRGMRAKRWCVRIDMLCKALTVDRNSDGNDD